LADEAILVLTQMPDHETADALALALLERKLAACVSIGAPVESLYHWRGKIETGREVPVTIKTRRERYADVEAAVRAAHPYELPEIVAVPLVYGLQRYLDWIAAETAPD
jgi:periplasmic divalent cation tolerance protein